MRDRVPAPGMAGRTRITPEIGSPITEPFFATIEMADNAIDGTDLNAANLLADETAEALGVESDDPTVNEAFLAVNTALKGKVDLANAISDIGIRRASFAIALPTLQAGESYTQDFIFSPAMKEGKSCVVSVQNRGEGVYRAGMGTQCTNQNNTGFRLILINIMKESTPAMSYYGSYIAVQI